MRTSRQCQDTSQGYPNCPVLVSRIPNTKLALFWYPEFRIPKVPFFGIRNSGFQKCPISGFGIPDTKIAHFWYPEFRILKLPVFGIRNSGSQNCPFLYPELRIPKVPVFFWGYGENGIPKVPRLVSGNPGMTISPFPTKKFATTDFILKVLWGKFRKLPSPTVHCTRNRRKKTTVLCNIFQASDSAL